MSDLAGVKNLGNLFDECTVDLVVVLAQGLGDTADEILINLLLVHYVREQIQHDAHK